MFLSLAASLGMASEPSAPSGADIEVFTQSGCPRCVAAKEFLQSLAQRRPGLRILEQRVDSDPPARARLRELGAARGMGGLAVPAFFVRGELLVGFRSTEVTGREIEALLERERIEPAPNLGGEVCTIETICSEASPPVQPPGTVDLPLLGPTAATDIGLPLFTVVIGLIDGFNPCAIWVLLFVLSLLVNLRNRLRMALIGGTFVVASGLAYYAFMAAWLNVFLLVGLVRTTQIVLGVVAVIAGAIHLKDFVAFGRGVSLSIPDAVKPTIYARVRRVVYAENTRAALAAAVVLAILVNTVELLCTAGLPALYTRILTMNELPWWKYHAYLALYNAAYMFDDSVMLAVAVVTLSRRKLQEGGGRWLKLVSGAVMVALGIVLIGFPGWLALSAPR